MEIKKLDQVPAFKKDITRLEMYGIEKIAEMMNDEEILGIDPEGFSYDPSGEYGTYNYHDEYVENDERFIGFAVAESGILIAIVTDLTGEEYSYHAVTGI